MVAGWWSPLNCHCVFYFSRSYLFYTRAKMNTLFTNNKVTKVHGNIKYVYKWFNKWHLQGQVCPISLLITSNMWLSILPFTHPIEIWPYSQQYPKELFLLCSMLVCTPYLSLVAIFDCPFAFISPAGSGLTSSINWRCTIHSAKPTWLRY